MLSINELNIGVPSIQLVKLEADLWTFYLQNKINVVSCIDEILIEIIYLIDRII